MVGSLGLFSLVLVAVLSSIIGVHSFYQMLNKRTQNIGLIRSFSLSSALFSLTSVALLGYAFVSDDFSILYVAEHSNTQLPSFFKLAAVWAGHEGSLLFWVLTISVWSGVIALQKHYSNEYQSRVLWVMNLLLAIFAWFTLFASNPFEMNSILPLEGRDLNPMLQDVGLIFHPPLLYLGYVGFSVVLAFAVAALLVDPIEFDWVAHCRSWCLVAWIFLTAGIILGSWWAYYELGWGGWWFWDPVENASLLPWLTSTALLHSLGVAKGKQQLLKWSLSLAFITFCLSILGTFIVRSGVLTSVHAFAVDPTKGIALLLILVLVLVSSFSLLIIRGESFESNPITSFVSKSFLSLVAVLIFVLATAVVVFGTFYPMVFELLGLGNISVGAPYFNLLIAPLALLALGVVGLAPLLSVKPQATKGVISLLALVSLALGYACYSWQVEQVQLQVMALLTWGLAFWVLLTHIYGLVVTRSSKFQRKVWVMTFAHVGVAVLAVGAAMNSYHSFERSYKLSPGAQVEFMDWTLSHRDTELYVASNFTAEKAILNLDADDKSFTIAPERRHYQVRVMNMSEPAMKWFWHGDVYITMGEKVDSTAYAFRVQYKAYARWIWFGGLFSILGALLSLTHRKKKTVKASQYAYQRS
ncbi:heme lyase CcmF/NrfE family subunit [Vibrio splendidus]|uniref:Cytochrome c nitrate reductase biogenesis protein NrfE n=1 Tax=Vibrio splendidus TaxID=29497 RepID=A0A2N7P6X4_VIBSP|nr:heme lyase CcmF/NrfE family subunit [Vibrio splendidus]PMF18259.1 cytochrome c nitrate reductase biogenesis protein NrfE [Vibrio splendidus]PMO95027.1 cytochrome c nitrate reductase biogenesis protein NrfE [Vibrio splendidus]PMP24808.1 cytochrome c nitrate reductase biogenesis protein NrfE [Vibrio splendidus]PMP32217.1 cytochrome c nitrate reductase biogenesis protein NrfE [Vibrio splendidus]PMP45526.1 cytochrome c nitrate reductase biogenesis protein NrfE [Vibrio splendidus]